MINKILKQGTSIGIIVSIVGFIILNLFSVSEEFASILERVYQLTITLGLLFILTVSKFVNEKFSKILRAIGIVLSIMFIMNLLSEFNIYQFESVEKISLILFSGLYFMYSNYFFKKNEKTKLDFLKITFLTLVLVGGLLKQYDLYLSVLKIITQSVFWVVIIGILLREHSKSRMKYSD